MRTQSRCAAAPTCVSASAASGFTSSAKISKGLSRALTIEMRPLTRSHSVNSHDPLQASTACYVSRLIGAECLQAVECLPIAEECPLLLSAQRFYSLSNACTLIEFRDPNHKVDINLAPLQTRRFW